MLLEHDEDIFSGNNDFVFAVPAVPVLREPPVEEANDQAAPLSPPSPDVMMESDDMVVVLSEERHHPFPLFVPGPRTGSLQPLPLSLSGFTELSTEPDEHDDNIVGKQDHQVGTFPFEKHLLLLAFWQALFITEAVLSEVSAPMTKVPDFLSACLKGPVNTAGHVWVLQHFGALKQQGILQDICFGSVKAFQWKQSNKSKQVLAAWCLHCPFCPCFISCSKLLNVYKHFDEHHRTDPLAAATLESFAFMKECCTHLEGFSGWKHLEQEEDGVVFPGSQNVFKQFDVFTSVQTFRSFSSTVRMGLDASVFGSMLVSIWIECFQSQFQQLLEDIATRPRAQKQELKEVVGVSLPGRSKRGRTGSIK